MLEKQAKTVFLSIGSNLGNKKKNIEHSKILLKSNNIEIVKTSKNYLKSKSLILSQENGVQVLIPPNYANGHLCLTNKCLFHYKLSYRGKYIDAKEQFSLRWNDPKLKIKWKIIKPILSKRDKKAKLL